MSATFYVDNEVTQKEATLLLWYRVTQWYLPAFDRLTELIESQNATQVDINKCVDIFTNQVFKSLGNQATEMNKIDRQKQQHKRNKST